MIRRPPRSTLSSSSAASDVYKRQDGRMPFAEEHEHCAAAHVVANSLGHNSSQPIEAPSQIDGLEADEDLDTVGNHRTPSTIFRVSTSSSTIASVPRSNPLGTTSRIPPTSTAMAPAH